MRVLVLAAALLASSLGPSFAEDEGKAPIPAQPQTTPAQPNQNADRPRDEGRERGHDRMMGRDREAGSDRETDHDHMMGHDWRMGRGGEMPRGSPDMMERDREMMRGGREMGRDWRMGGDRDRRREERDWDRRGENGYYHFYDEGRERRIRICIEYDNGDEYCRYRRERLY